MAHKTYKTEFRSLEFKDGSFGIDFIIGGMDSHDSAHRAAAIIKDILAENAKRIFGETFVVPS